MKKIEKEIEVFCSVLRNESKVSAEYAVAAWFTLTDKEKSVPVNSAHEYIRRFLTKP